MLNIDDKTKTKMVVNIYANAPRTKKFWCHYLGSDGNTPKRRSIELTDLGSLFSFVGDTQHCATPLWYEKGEDYYYLYAQLDNKVAVRILGANLWDKAVEEANQTDEEIEAYWRARREDPNDWIEEKDVERHAKSDKERRDKRKAMFAEGIECLKDYDAYLLTSASWVPKYCLCAYEEANSPILSTLQALRKAFEAKREEEDRKRDEERRRQREEQERKEAEEKAKEYDRLTQEAEKFKAGERISGYDVNELCRRYGIQVHLRTVHNLQQVITEINGKGECLYRKAKGRWPVLDGCYSAARKLYDYLQTNKTY